MGSHDPLRSAPIHHHSSWKTCPTHLLVESPASFIDASLEALEAETIAAVKLVVVVLAAAVESTGEEATGSKTG